MATILLLIFKDMFISENDTTEEEFSELLSVSMLFDVVNLAIGFTVGRL